MLNRYVKAWSGIGLPNPQIDISGLNYDRQYGDAPPGSHVDLSFAALAKDLELELIDQHDALADAVTTALMYLTLKDMQARRARIPRAAYAPAAGFMGG
jgi:DNA polymerase-3 subunit epsilon